MVFHSHSKNETLPSNSNSVGPNMSSPPPPPTTPVAKPPLHNFALPDLKWAMNHTNTNRFRKQSDSSQNNAVSDKQRHQNHNQSKSPLLQGVNAGVGNDKLAKRKPTSSDDVAHNPVKKPAGPGISSSDGSRSRIFIRLKTSKSSKAADEITVAAAGERHSAPDDASDDLLVPKTWNLRPRRLLTKTNNHKHNNNVNAGGALKIGGGVPQEKREKEKEKEKKEKEKEKETAEDKDKGKEKEIEKDREKEEETEKEKDTDKEKKKEQEKVKGKEKKQNMSFSISLTIEEIEDDFYAMTGTKPSRRPKKRAKNVQKQLDYVSPGLWLDSITPDSYKVNDSTKKLKG